MGNFWYPSGQDGNPANVQVAGVDYANYPTGSSGHEVYVFEQSVPLAAGKTVAAVTLPAAGQRGRLQRGAAHLRDDHRLSSRVSSHSPAAPGQAAAGLTRRPAVQTPVTWPGSASTAMSASGSASSVITSAS